MPAYTEIIALLASNPTPEQIMAFRLSDAAIERVRELLYKNSAGTLSDEESTEMDECARLNQEMMLLRAQLRLRHRDSEEK